MSVTAVAAVVFGAVLPMSAWAAPGNDLYLNARPVTSLPFQIRDSFAGATLEAGEPVMTCGANTASIWFRYTATASQTIHADTHQAEFDTLLAVYEASATPVGVPALDLTLLSCNNDDRNIASAVDLTATSGKTYYFQLGTNGLGSGTFVFNIGVPPANDSKSSATDISSSIPYSVITSTVGATTVDSDFVPCNYSGATTWYKLTSATDTHLLVDTAGSVNEIGYPHSTTSPATTTPYPRSRKPRSPSRSRRVWTTTSRSRESTARRAVFTFR